MLFIKHQKNNKSSQKFQCSYDVDTLILIYKSNLKKLLLWFFHKFNKDFLFFISSAFYQKKEHQ